MAIEGQAPAPAPAGTPAAAPAPSQPVTAGVDPSEAGRALASRRAEIRAKLMGKEAAPADPKAVGSASPASGAAPTTTTAAAEAAPQTADDDEIAVLIEAQRKQGETAKQLDARKVDLDRREAAIAEAEKEAKEYIPSVKAAREALAKGDHMGALLAVFPHDLVVGDLHWAILKYQEEHGGEPAKAAPIDLDAEFKKRLTAWQEEQKAEQEKKANEARGAMTQARDGRDGDMGAGFGAALVSTVKTVNVGGQNIETSKAPPEVVRAVVGGYADYVMQTFAEVKGNAAKYPAFVRIRPTVIQVVERLEELRAKGGQVPPVADVAGAVEAWLRGPQEAPPEVPKPASTVTDDWRRPAGGVDPNPQQGPQSYMEKRAAIRAKLRAS